MVLIIKIIKNTQRIYSIWQLDLNGSPQYTIPMEHTVYIHSHTHTHVHERIYTYTYAGTQTGHNSHATHLKADL